jgi:hypothetical protein
VHRESTSPDHLRRKLRPRAVAVEPSCAALSSYGEAALNRARGPEGSSRVNVESVAS